MPNPHHFTPGFSCFCSLNSSDGKLLHHCSQYKIQLLYCSSQAYLIFTTKQNTNALQLTLGYSHIYQWTYGYGWCAAIITNIFLNHLQQDLIDTQLQKYLILL